MSQIKSHRLNCLKMRRVSFLALYRYFYRIYNTLYKNKVASYYSDTSWFDSIARMYHHNRVAARAPANLCAHNKFIALHMKWKFMRCIVRRCLKVRRRRLTHFVSYRQITRACTMITEMRQEYIYLFFFFYF